MEKSNTLFLKFNPDYFFNKDLSKINNNNLNIDIENFINKKIAQFDVKFNQCNENILNQENKLSLNFLELLNQTKLFLKKNVNKNITNSYVVLTDNNFVHNDFDNYCFGNYHFNNYNNNIFDYKKFEGILRNQSNYLENLRTENNLYFNYLVSSVIADKI